jgi:3-dehydroquinate dehydratase
MGMTIEESKRNLSHAIKWNDRPTNESMMIAIDTMHKYQKIQEIIADWRSDGGAFEMSENYWLRLISEVIEDGKIDRC